MKLQLLLIARPIIEVRDHLSSAPLSPNLLLTMKSDVVLPLPGNFQNPNIFSR